MYKPTFKGTSVSPKQPEKGTLYTGKTWLREESVESFPWKSLPPSGVEALPVLRCCSRCRVHLQSVLEAPLEGLHRLTVHCFLWEQVVQVHKPKERSPHDLCGAEPSGRVQLSVVSGSPVSQASHLPVLHHHTTWGKGLQAAGARCPMSPCEPLCSLYPISAIHDEPLAAPVLLSLAQA